MAEKTKQKPQLTGAFELFSKSSRLVQNNLTTFIIIYLLPLLTNLASLRHTWSQHSDSVSYSYFSGFINGTDLNPGAVAGIGAVFGIIFLAVWLILNAMTVGLQLESSQSRKAKLDDLWPYARKYWLRLFGLLMLILIFTIAGLILFIVPGLIMIRRYFLAPYVLVDQDVGIWEALSKSAAMTKPYSRYIWSIIGVQLLISLPSVVPVVGWAVSFILGILYSVAPALRYQELKKIAAS